MQDILLAALPVGLIVFIMGIETPRSITWAKNYGHIYPLNYAGEYSWEIAICRGEPAKGICEQLAVSERGVFVFSGCLPTVPVPTR